VVKTLYFGAIVSISEKKPDKNNGSFNQQQIDNLSHPRHLGTVVCQGQALTQGSDFISLNNPLMDQKAVFPQQLAIRVP